MKYKRGEIVLAEFPFTDGTGAKQRPVLILSPASTTYNDYLVMFISSQLSNAELDDVILLPDDIEFQKTGLNKPSVFKLLKLTTLSETLILGVLGEVSSTFFLGLVRRLINKLT
ncbi:MAG: type II toxin-antitoxin system PemK/MazF family toxin [Chloroherpetonaceae bacterium]|nr:type II toxin-antitoxin system PemK/MazF family toxin [Chloroherpetonaceae bacterium]